MTRASLVAIAALSVGLACTDNGRSVVLVEVNAGAGVVGVDKVFVHITRDGQSLRHAEGSGPLPVKLGVYLPKEVSGLVNIEVCAFTAAASGTQESVRAMNMTDPVTVAAGQTIGPIAAVLVSGTPFAVCGGTGGTGGRGGSGGSTGGSSPGNAGTGGSVGGTSGTGGGGVAGTGGVGGTGGMSGTGGSTGGRGGAGGSGGAAGTGGGGATGGTGGGGTGGAAGWHGPVPVSGSQTNDVRPSVAVPYTGNAVIVYERGSDIYSVRYDAPADEWSAPSLVATGQYGRPVVWCDGPGRFTAVWDAALGAATQRVWWSTSDNGVNWKTPAEALSPDGSYAFKPVLAVNAGGMAIAAWLERVSGSNSEQVVASLRVNGNWSPVKVMKGGDDANDRHPAVNVTDAGDAFVLWEQIDPNAGVNSIWYQHFDRITNQWKPDAERFETFDGGAASAPAIVSNPTGNAIATYVQRVSPNLVQLWARRFTNGSWDPALKVGDATSIDSTQPPSVFLDNNGTATVAWGADISGQYNVHTNRSLQFDTMWPPMPMAMETDNTASESVSAGRATLPAVYGDGAGNVTLIWRKLVGGVRFDLVARRYTGGTGGGWGPVWPLETADVNGVFGPVLGNNSYDRPVAVWYYGNSLDIYANVFRP